MISKKIKKELVNLNKKIDFDLKWCLNSVILILHYDFIMGCDPKEDSKYKVVHLSL